MKYVLGIDFGGGASKATLLSSDGETIATSITEYPTVYPQNGWTEQDPDDWYSATKRGIGEILAKSGVSPTDIIAVSLDAATHTAVIMDKDFNVLRPSIYWTDSRTIKQVELLKSQYRPIILSQVLHEPGTIWTLPQLMWIRENQPEIWAKTKKICFAKDYVRHKLTGDFVTDFIEAEGSMLFDYTHLCWSDELCSVAGVDKECLPSVIKPTDIAGTVTKSAAADTGLAKGTVVLCGTTDTVMEVFAAGGVEKGRMTLKLATAGRICVITDKAYPDKNLINYSHFADGLWYPGTATKSCAASYRWYRDTFGGDYRKLDDCAASIPIGCDGLTFHPYLNGELTPYNDPKLCASFTGVRSCHTKAHFTRAVLEGVGMSMLDCMKTLCDIGIEHNDKAVIIGGGGKSPLWRSIVSDALGLTLEQKENSDSSFGSAMLAGIASGLWKSASCALEACNKTVSQTEPNAENTAKYAQLYKRYRAIQSALEPFYDNTDI